ncbi:hypothetical protein PO909_022320 [Leuciscus waleckii]
MGDPQNRNELISSCVGCGHQIQDRFILRVSPDLEWHAQCLRCAECHQCLDESRTCFIRDGKTFCKDHRYRLCSSKCARCRKAFVREEYVMRTRVNIYHIQCFRCESCSRPLLPGDEYVLRDGQLLCTDHHERRLLIHPVKRLLIYVSITEGMRSSASWSSRSERATRVRTVLSESQLRMLQTCYSANPRPDALMKEQLVEMTGLSPRVIRVWFQNKRCKDKKRSVMMRHTVSEQVQNLHIVSEDLMLASPESQDSDMRISPPWKLLTDFILQKNAEHRSYQHLLSLSKEGPCSAGSEVVSISTHYPDTPNSLTTSATDISE